MRPSEPKARELIAIATLGRVFQNELLPSIVKNVFVKSQCDFWSQWVTVGTGFARKTKGQYNDLSIICIDLTKMWEATREAEALAIPSLS